MKLKVSKYWTFHQKIVQCLIKIHQVPAYSTNFISVAGLLVGDNSGTAKAAQGCVDAESGSFAKSTSNRT